MKIIVFVFLFMHSAFLDKVYGSKTKPTNKEKITLNIEPPEHYFEETYIRAGEKTKIICKASALRDFKLEWYNPSEEMVKWNPNSRVTVQKHFQHLRSRTQPPSLALEISDAQVEDTGVWECRYGNVVQEFSLCVIDPTDFMDTPNNVTVDEGHSISLTCLTKGNPEPRVTWYREGEPIIDDGSKYTIGTKYSSQWVETYLTVKSVIPDDAGVYTCEAQQHTPLLETCGSTTSFNISMQVNYAPFFVESAEKLFLFSKNNESITLQCAAQASPKPTYVWSQELEDGVTFVEVLPTRYTVSEDGTLSNLTLGSSGLWDRRLPKKFKCEVDNGYDEAELYFVVLKLRKPTEPQTITPVDVTDTSIDFNVTWNKLFSEIDAFPVDGYNIQYTPTKKKSSKESRRSSLYTDDFETRQVISDVTQSIIISLPNLEPETDYWVRVHLRNEAGSSPWYGPFFAQTGPEIEEDQQYKLKLKSEDEPFISNGVIVGLVTTVLIIAFAAGCITVIKKL